MEPNVLKAIQDVIQREGGSTLTNNPLDKGGRTIYGISEKSNPAAWKNGPPTLYQAIGIYESEYVKAPGYDKIPVGYAEVQSQLIDFAVTSGPKVATETLQTLLNVPVDGVLGPQSLATLQKIDPRTLNNHLVAQRVIHNCKVVVADPSQLGFLVGWNYRALTFLC